MKKINLVQQFGRALDRDDFDSAKKLLAIDCVYQIGNELLKGPEAICNSYEQNMLEGRKKLDELVWGDSKVTKIDDHCFYIHFTDYLKHQGISHTFSCKQKVQINDQGLIFKIEHEEDPEERAKLQAFYKKVGIN